ncbi:MAG: tripartite tricarboxylate transporter TctB family protein [Marinomonas sp.]|uniref:tripartite tricarboxylate transporter TctB family protein n=1 Tax=Marinomonas sp. TaxID=1904862 RepID=UPI003F9B241B
MFHLKEQHVFYLFLMAGAGFFLKLSWDIPSGIGVENDPGAAFLPIVICVLILFLVSYLFVIEFREKSEKLFFSRAEFFALAGTLLLIFVYIFILSLIGFFASTIIFLFLFQRLNSYLLNSGGFSYKSYLVSALFSFIATLSIYFVFSVLFKMSLP